MTKFTKLLLGGGASAGGLALAIIGTLFYNGNLVSTQQYTTSRLINNTVPYEVTSQTGSTATGGLRSGGAQGNYQAITIASPQSSANAARNGLSTGTGVNTLAIISAVAPQASGFITCSIAATTVRGTGGTIVVPRTAIGTGTTVLRSTGAIVMGPNESFRCSVGFVPSASFDVRAIIRNIPSQVVN